MRWLYNITDLMDMNLSEPQEVVKGQGKAAMLQSMESKRVGHNLVIEQPHTLRMEPYVPETQESILSAMWTGHELSFK